MKHVFSMSPNGYWLTTPQTPTFDKPEAGIYVVVVTEDMSGIKVELQRQPYDRFVLPEKIYGRQHSKRLGVIGTVYHNRLEKGKNTSISLDGEKGSGKTLLAHSVCNKALDEGKIVYIINSYVAAAILERLADLSGNCVFLFDEFDKTYPFIRDEDGHSTTISDKQESILNFLSDDNLGGTLNILVGNDKPTPFTLNRPERVFLRYSFECVGKLPKDEFLYICDQLNILESLMSTIMYFKKYLNLDGLIAIAHACNEYGYDESLLTDVLDGLNVELCPPPRVKSMKARLEVDSTTTGLSDIPDTLDMSKFSLTYKIDGNSFESDCAQGNVCLQHDGKDVTTIELLIPPTHIGHTQHPIRTITYMGVQFKVGIVSDIVRARYLDDPSEYCSGVGDIQIAHNIKNSTDGDIASARGARNLVLGGDFNTVRG